MSTDHQDNANAIRGLTQKEAEERKAAGLTNKTDSSNSRSVSEIIISNIFTYFNLIFLVLSVLLIIARSYRNLTFLPVVIINTLVGIIQELRAKHVLDEMNILNAPHSSVMRNSVLITVPSEELVKDDVVLLSSGDQICADASVISGSIRVNEALLTGEADEIEKNVGSSLLSGSFVVAGTCYARLEKVGNDSYISKLTAEAKAMSGSEQSEMIRCINAIVKWVGIAIIPIGIILYLQAHFINHETFSTSITSMVAAVIGMIPEGLYLLTTAALALGTIRLSRKKVLLHEMKSIETLARVDILCVDKTGTITEPDMSVTDTVWLENAGNNSSACLFADYVNASTDTNSTMQALKRFASGMSISSRTALKIEPFSSKQKYGSIDFEDGTYLLGAPDYVMGGSAESSVKEKTAPYLKSGKRVLLFAKLIENTAYKIDTAVNDKEQTHREITPLGIIVLSNPVRKNAADTFRYFDEQDVTIKVISGDDPETVSSVAMEAGIKNADKAVDASLLDTEAKLRAAASKYTIFGRVSPEQKRKLVHAMQLAGHTVAMTGDGVNDILAMKDADCSVAMASGSEAAAQAAQVVLLDSDFAHMPDVVLEGRRVVNNVQRSSSLFLVKNIFSLLLALISVILAITYPLQPAQVSLVAMFTIGTPGFLLALEKSTTRIQGHFLKNVLMKALPAAITDTAAVCIFVTCGDVFSLAEGEISTAAVIILSLVGFMILLYISRSLNKWRAGVLAFNIAGWLFCCHFMKWWFGLSHMSFACTLLTIVFAVGAESVFRHLTLLCEWIDKRLNLGDKQLKKRRTKYLTMSGRN